MKITIDTMNEVEAVQTLGKFIGFGRMMQLAESEWRRILIQEDYTPGGEYSCGPCVALLFRCLGCPEGKPSKCDWCCGAGRVTKRVNAAIMESLNKL